jgi:DNA-directed RNA polymerase specialized sigma24 family protein
VLNGTLSLQGIDDVEPFAVAIVQRSRIELNHHDREDLITYLVETCWELSLRYEPGGISFSTWAGATLRNRIVDWQRKRYGRTRYVFSDRVFERKLPELVSLDADGPSGDSLGDTLGTRAGDPAADRGADLARLLGAGSSTRTRDYEALGLKPPRRAP